MASPVRLLIFDWDGTAVEGRAAKAEGLTQRLERLLELGVLCVVFTGTSLEKIRAQCFDLLPARAKRDLWVCANRGSEVFGFGPEGEPRALYRRIATPAEERALDAIAEGIQGFPIIRDRLNRRKVDLIPVERWKDPRKSEFAELLAAVEERLSLLGVPGGLAGVLERARGLAAALPGAKITSDIKHVEIGLTDKADSVRWVLENLIRPRGIPLNEILVAGDEFGIVGGMPGSDSLTRIEGLEGVRFISVGVEPNGVPPWVRHLPGGPVRFLEILDELIAAWEREIEFGAMPTLRELVSRDPSWLLAQEGFDPAREREMESLFTVGNGAMGVRGGLSLGIPISQGDLFVRGLYDRKSLLLPYSESRLLTVGQEDSPDSEIVSFPFPFRVAIACGDGKVVPTHETVGQFRRELCLRSGVLTERMRLRASGGGEILVRSERLAPLDNPRILLQEIELGSTQELLLSVDLSAEDPELGLRHPHLAPLPQLKPRAGLAEQRSYRTSASGISVSFATRLWIDGRESESCLRELRLGPGRTAFLRRLTAVCTSRDFSDPEAAAREALEAASGPPLEAELRASQDRWSGFWKSADIRLHGPPEPEVAQRFGSYHLRIAAGRDPRGSIGARTLSGRAYEGHVFWDAEIFMLPFLLHTEPELARACLDYRYLMLDGARQRARELGYAGACYPWESTSSGQDETPVLLRIHGVQREIPIFTGLQQIHVTADIAHAVWRYWEATGDDEWLSRYGTEILAETARFWVSRAVSSLGRLHIRGVVGPDEYHHDVDDNAYTNWMARFNLEKAAWAADRLRAAEPARWQELASRVGLREAEAREWQDAAQRIFIPRPSSAGVIPQFEGYFDLSDPGVRSDDTLTAPIRRLLDWEQANGEQIIKQADVLMIPFLFPDALDREKLAANYAYYEPRTEHGSSLSPGVHAAIAATLGKAEDARRYWRIGSQMDLLNLMGNTSLGIHAGCIGATWQALVFHALGIRVRGRELVVERSGPGFLPEGCREIELSLVFRGESRKFRFTEAEGGEMELKHG